MKLPNGARAELGSKLGDYSLNPLHREGRNKARVFASALGITAADADVLRAAVLAAAVRPTTPCIGETTALARSSNCDSR
ncbi:MAG: hypothetical protein M3463_13475 [Verrucomicrobiota bacterium]|nr:hypothetical protein [Verrucomicrobiota bacterium]